MSFAILTRFSYPKVPGDQPDSIVDATGPVSYTPLTPGSPGVAPTGAQKITARDFGLQSLDFVWAMGSDDGKYFGIVVPDTVPQPPSPPTPQQLPDGSFEAVLLVWMNVTGGEASGDLSQSIIRLFARGR